jgi:hypothetical protein
MIKSKPLMTKCLNFQDKKVQPEGKSTTTPILQNDQQKGADETATEQELPPLHSAYLTLFDVTTHLAQPDTNYNSQTNSTNKPTTDNKASKVETWRSGKLTTKRLEHFASTVLPSSVQVQPAQPFGKDTITQSFYAEKCFRHILLPLVKSGYLSC